MWIRLPGIPDVLFASVPDVLEYRACAERYVAIVREYGRDGDECALHHDLQELGLFDHDEIVWHLANRGQRQPLAFGFPVDR